MTRYNHLFSIAFPVIADEVDPYTVPPRKLRAAILRRLNSIEDSELLEACQYEDDTVEEPDET